MLIAIRRRAIRCVVAAAVLLPAVGCGPDTLDTTSLVDLQESLAVLREPMNEAELARFDEALDFLVGELSLDTVDPADAEPALDRFRPLAGLTAEGIVAKATFRRVRDVRSTVTWMETWRDSTEEDRRELAKFRFGDATVYKRHKGFLEWPLIEFKVENGTDHAVSLVRVRASLLSPDDLKPWLEEEFDHLMMGGLEPGGRDVWRVEPDQREWIQLIDPHPDVDFNLEATRLVAPGGGVIVSTDWSAIEDHYLATFRDTLRTIRSTGTLALDRPPHVDTPVGFKRPTPTVTGGDQPPGRAKPPGHAASGSERTDPRTRTDAAVETR
jgi:hypothetical protein